MAKWIDAKKRPPKERGEYLTFYVMHTRHKDWNMYGVMSYDATYNDWWEKGDTRLPTHYMRLPKPPELSEANR